MSPEQEPIEKSQKATEIYLTDAEAYLNWGNELFNLNQYEEAIDMIFTP